MAPSLYKSHGELLTPSTSGRRWKSPGGKDLTPKAYPQTRHGFFNDTRKEVCNRDVANEAWDTTKRFLTERSEDTELADCFVTWSYIVKRSKKKTPSKE
jgi:dienelactone hydrolase